MSLFDDASLVLIPDGAKDGKLYSVKPTDGTGDFTFSRGSNLAATRVDENGLIEKGRENLLLQSNQFDTTWSINNASVTGGQSGYDGTNNAWRLTADSTGTFRRLSQSTNQNYVVTSSVYAKAGTADHLYMVPANMSYSTGGYQFFDLTNGTLGASNFVKIIDASIEDVGGGWYRCTIVSQPDILGAAYFGLSNNDTDTTITSGNYIYIQDAQLEVGLVATDYIETGATTAQAGILEDLPRIDYSGGASCPALLLEPQRTNIVTNSEYLEGDFGLADLVSVSLENITAPDGSNLVTKVQANGDTVGRAQDNLGTLGANHIYSGFFKGTGVATRLRFRNNQGSEVRYDIDASGNFTLVFEDAANDNYNIEDYGNGWYRIWFETATSAVGANYVQIYPDYVDGNGSVYAWGIQAEEGSYPTSYIPTYGSSVTRSADSGVSDVDSLLASNATYTWMVEFIVPEIGNGGGEITFKDAGGSSQLRIYCNQNSMVGLRVDDNSQNYYIPVSVGDTAKCLFQCTNGLVKGFYNGALVKTFNIDTGMDAQKIHLGPPVAAPEVKQVLLFNTALTDSECIALTTL